MGESLMESRTETTLPAPGGQRGTEPRHAAGAPGRRGPIGTQRDGGAAPAEGHEAVVLLERARAEVDPVLRAALGSLPGPLRRIALYHFGWEQADGSPAEGVPARRSGPHWSSPRRPPSAGPRHVRERPGPPRRWNWSTTSRCCTTM